MRLGWDAMKRPRRPHFRIHWVQVGQIDPDLSILREPLLERTCGIYVLFAGKKTIQYVGMTFRQTFSRRIRQHFQSLARVGASVPEECYLFVGLIEPLAYKRLSKKMLQEIESFLIWSTKPGGNTAKKTPYQGREMLIGNTGAGFGLPNFLYVCSLGPIVVVGQGEDLGDIRTKTIPPSAWPVIGSGPSQ